MKTILLFGKDGQVGSELRQILQPLGQVVALGKNACDLSQPDTIVKAIRGVAPTLIINAAAYTAVDKAEEEPDIAYAINAKAPGIIAEEAKKAGVPFLHYSTDYVFDGRSAVPYKEGDHPRPINIYGKTKWIGEQAVEAASGFHIILRTSWIYSDRGRNFFLSIMKLAAEREELRIVDDQTGTPNWARVVAEATALAVKQLTPELAGTYHLSCQGATTWFGFAHAFIEGGALKKRPLLSPIKTGEYPSLARRPRYSVLDSSKFAEAFGQNLPSWEETLKLFLYTYRQKDTW